MTLAELIIKLSADTAVLKSDFEKGKQYANDFASGVSSILGAIGTSLPGLSAGAITKELMDLADSTAKVGEQIYKMEQITGLGAEDLSGLRAISEESSESFEGLSTTLARAGKNIEEAFIKPSGTAGKLLGALFTDAEIASMKLEPANQRLEQITKAIFGLSDAAERDFAASTIFGKGWMANVETLQKLADEGFAGAREAANIFGITMSEDQVKMAHEFREAWEDADLTMKGFSETMGYLVVAAAHAMAGPLLDLSEQMDQFKGIIPARTMGFENASPKALGAFANSQMPDWAKNLNITVPKTSLADLMNDKGAATSTSNAVRPYEDIGPMEDFKHVQEELQSLMKQWEGVLTPLSRAWEEYYDRLAKVQAISGRTDTTALQQESLQKLGADIQKAAESTPMMSGFGAGGASQSSMMALLPSITILQQTHDQFATLQADAYNFGEKASNAFTKMLVTGKGFDATMKTLIDDLAEFLLKTVVFQNLSKGLMSMGGGGGIIGTLGAFFGGLAGKAAGGPVNYGSNYLVGENGPELFTPTTSGMIVPNDALNSLGGQGSGGGVTYQIDARGADAGVEHRINRASMQAQQKATVNGYLMSQEMAKRGA